MENYLPKKQRPKEAAKNYGIAISTLWLYIAEGKLRTTKPSPRVTLLDTKELEVFFNGKTA